MNQPIRKRLFSGAAGTLALTVRRATTLTATRAAMMLLVMMLTMTAQTAWADWVTYIDEDGNKKTESNANVLNGGGATTLTAGLYVVTHDITYTGTVTLAHDVKIVLMDGYTMNIGTSESRLSGKGFNYKSSESLTIYGQTNGTGTLNVYTSGESNYAIWAGAITINGGHVIADTDGNNANAIYAEAITINGGHVTAHTAGNYAYAIYSRISAFTYNGGIVSATTEDASSDKMHGYNAPAIASGNYTFNWRSATDRITIGTTGLSFDPNAPSGYETNATFSKPFSDGTTTYSGTLTGTELNALAGKTPQPAYTITYDLAGGSVATANPTTYTIESAAITLNNPTREGYTFAGWTGTGLGAATTSVTIAHGSTGDRSYTATWRKLLANTDITVTIPSMEWTGSELTPTITVKDGETALTETTDYTVTLPSGRTNSGDYTVTLTGAGNYDGTTTETFTITPKTVTVKNSSDEDVPAATGDATITQDENGITLTLITPTGTDAPQTVSIPTAVEVDHVTIQRTYVSGKASTVYLPFSIEVSKLSGGTFHTFTNVDQTTSPWTVNYSEALASTATLEANTPYLFLPDGTNEGKIVVNNGTDKVSVCTANPQTTTQGQWEFIGTYEPIVWAAEHADLGKVYGFAAIDKEVEGKNITAGQFVKAVAGASIAPMRAYLKYTPPSAAPARGTSRVFATDELPATMRVVIAGANGETTEVGTIGIEQYSGEWYTIDGRKLSGAPTKKGLYIHNGRKNVIK